MFFLRFAGGNWPTTVALWFVDFITWKSCEGADGTCYTGEAIHVSLTIACYYYPKYLNNIV